MTFRIGSEFRKFNKRTCPAFDTRELRRETNARKRRHSKKASVSKPASKPESASGPLPKKLNIQTYKHHSLGDYPKTIRLFGTTDSYSTEPVREIRLLCHVPQLIHALWLPQGELEHRTSKSRYKRTDRKQFVKQLAQIERRQARIRRIRARDGTFPRERVDMSPVAHHHIGISQNDYLHIGTFLRKNLGDPAVRV
jgi:hypothetical protein